MMRRVFVTGGAGFIGSAFVRLALDAFPSCEITNFDALTYAGSMDNLEGLDRTRHRFVRGDISDREAVFSALENETDAIVNFAAESHVDRSIVSTDEFLRTNVSGTQVLLDAARTRRVRRFMQVSCYDEQTRALTKEGLKYFSELRVGDKVLSLNQASGEIEEKEVEKVIVQDYEGTMIHFKTSLADLKVTPNHRMYFRQKGREGLGHIQFDEARNLPGQDFLYYPRGNWRGQHHETIQIAGIGKVAVKELFYVIGVFIGDGFIATQEKKLPSRSGLDKRDGDEARRNPVTGRFETLTFAPGAKTGGTSISCRIFFDVPEKDQARRRLEHSLTLLGINWCEQKNRSGEHIYLCSKAWTEFFEQFGRGFKNKRLPEWILAFDRDALVALFDGLIESDGRFNKSGALLFSTSSHRLMENICELGIKLGLSPRIAQRDVAAVSWLGLENRSIRASTDAYLVHFRRGNIGLGQQNYVEEDYCGKIWCVKVKDNKNLIVERNGILQFCGNTDEVMGSLDESSRESFTESSPIAPRNPYAASKAAAEHLVQAAHHTFSLDTIITRCGNNYGPRQFPEKLLPLLITSALEDRPLSLYGDGLYVRDWIYVDDHCRALLRLLEGGSSGEVYHIGARNQRRNIDVARAVLDALGKPHSLIRYVKDRPGHDRRYAIDPAKVERETDWRPRETWESGLDKTIKWYMEHPQWVARVRGAAHR